MLTLALLATPALADRAAEEPACHPVEVVATHPADGQHVPVDTQPAIYIAGDCGNWGYVLSDGDGTVLARRDLAFDPSLETIVEATLTEGEHTLTIVDEVGTLAVSTFTVTDAPATLPTLTHTSLFVIPSDGGYHVEGTVETDGEAVIRMAVDGAADAVAYTDSARGEATTWADLPVSDEVCATFEVRDFDGSWTDATTACAAPVELPTGGVGCSNLSGLPGGGLLLLGLAGLGIRRR